MNLAVLSDSLIFEVNQLRSFRSWMSEVDVASIGPVKVDETVMQFPELGKDRQTIPPLLPLVDRPRSFLSVSLPSS